MSAAISLKGNIALDSSVLVEIFSDSELGRSVHSRLLGEDITAYTSQINVAEASYVVCRKVGHERAQAAARDLLDSGYVVLEEDPSIHVVASELKCERAISLVDCYTFAVAEVTGGIPVFAKEEEDLARAARKRAFRIEPTFLS